jgi:DNA invertase Pin-like site-specific DNA recombinase
MKTTTQADQFRDPMEAAVYVRVSNCEQSRSGVSEEAQVELAEAYRRSRNLRGSHVFREEGVSASTPLASRPAGARLLELVKAGVVKHIVAMNLDRLFRSAEDALRMTHKWDRQGVTLHLVDADGRAMDTSSVGGLLLLSGLAAVAAMKRNMIAERTAAAMAFMRRRGVVYSPTPYGCQRSGDGITRSMKACSSIPAKESSPDIARRCPVRSARSGLPHSAARTARPGR